ncbi:MAG: glycine cleavage system aminomethyltransferase GcvT [Gemmatimonadota bacterium]
MNTATTIKRTPFYQHHVELGARIVPFAGYEMPVQYPTGISAEHRAVREACGLFDVSHMGEFLVRGPGAVDFVNAVTTNDVAALATGQVHYSGILNDRGTFEDDCLVYRDRDSILMVVNASNREKDLARISRAAAAFDCTIEDVSDEIALLALQGPVAASVLGPLTDIDLDTIGYYHFARGTVARVADVIVSRTGYTGEDGFELYFDRNHASTVWSALVVTGRVTPAGLGCRDTLRLEMGMALYGNDIDDTVTPLEANLGWIVKLGKGEFTGRDALARQKADGVRRRLVGFTMGERAIPRHGYAVWCRRSGVEEQSGTVCSGTMSPSLGIGIGTCYLPTDLAKVGTEFEVDIRGKRAVATVVKPPFYKQASHL